MTNFERAVFRLMLATFAVTLLAGAVWGPRVLVETILSAGAPLSGEFVPRQIPYRGYLEQNGAPVPNANMPMQFRLLGIDGGELHRELMPAVVVQQGHFAIELGDASPFPADVLRQNYLDLEVSVGSPLQLLGRQRILTTPFAARAGDVSVARADLDVGNDLRVQGTISTDGGLVVSGLLDARGGLSQPTYVARFIKASAVTVSGPQTVTFSPAEVVEDTAGFFQGGTITIPKAGHYLVVVSGDVPFGVNNWLALHLNAPGLFAYQLLTVGAASGVAGIKVSGTAIRPFGMGQVLELGAQANSASTPVSQLTLELVRLGD